MKNLITILALALLSATAAFADQTHFAVKKMTCMKCAGKVKAALTKLPGVETVEIDTKAGKVAVTTKPNTSTPEQMIAAISGAGFPATLAK